MKVLMISRDPKAMDQGSQVFKRLVEYSKDSDELHVVVLGKGIKSKKINFGNLFLYPNFSKKGIIAFFMARREVISLAKKIQPNLVTVQDPFEAGFLGFLVKKKFGTSLQVQVHTDIFSPYFSKFSFRNWLQVKVARIVLSKASYIRVVSQRIKNSLLNSEIKNLNSIPIEIRPISVDAEKIKNTHVGIDLHKNFPQFKKIILMVGRLEREKNYPMALEAFGKVLKKYPETGLIVVGSGGVKLKKQKNVIFLGWSDDVYSCMKTADLFLHTAWFEGYGIVFKESEICGLPIISTDVGIAKEVGATIAPFDSTGIANAIIEKLK